MREFELKRTTKETDISLWLSLEGGESSIQTGCGFLNHMLELFAYHGRFGLRVSCVGDSHVDDHHTVEDVAICLGTAFREALAEKQGIIRYGDICLSMDEALIHCCLDFSGRAHLSYGLKPPTEKVGSFDTELVAEFYSAFVRAAQLALHLRQLAGENSHHIIEGSFKAFARALAQAVAIDPRLGGEIPSSKGVLS